MVKKTLLSMAIAAAVVSLAGCNVSTTDKYDNKIDNSNVTQAGASSVYPLFNPSPVDGSAAQLPLATDIIFAINSQADGTPGKDGTASTVDTGNPVTLAVNKLAGFSTVAPLYINFSKELDPASVVAGQTVFLVKLATKKQPLEAADNPDPKPVSPDVYEASPITLVGDDGQDVHSLRILFKKPLDPKSKYMVILTDGIKGTNGEAAGSSATYEILESKDFINNASDQVLSLRENIQNWQKLAGMVLGGKANSVFSYTFTTDGSLEQLKQYAAPGLFVKNNLTVSEAEDLTDSVSNQAVGTKIVARMVWLSSPLNASGETNPANVTPAQVEKIRTEEPFKTAYEKKLYSQIATTPLGAPGSLEDAAQAPKARTVVATGTSVPSNELTTSNSTKTTHTQGTIELPDFLGLPNKTVGLTGAPTDKLVVAGTLMSDPVWTANTTVGALLEGAGKPGLPPKDVIQKADGSTVETTNVTYNYPFPQPITAQTITVPYLLTLPGDYTSENGVDCTATKPYKTVIFVHGITANRVASAGYAAQLAKACIATVAIDLPLHGVAPEDGAKNVFSMDSELTGYTQWAGSGLFERHGKITQEDNLVRKDMSYANVKVGLAKLGEAQAAMTPPNLDPQAAQAAQAEAASAFEAAKADGSSGSTFINLQNFARTGDNLRQAVTDLLNLNASLENISTELDVENVYVAGHSLGGIVASAFVAVNNDPEVQAFAGKSATNPTGLPKIKGLIVANSGGQITKLLENSPGFAPKILGGLKGAGIEQGSETFEKFLYVFQSIIDGIDPANTTSALGDIPVQLFTVVGDAGTQTPPDTTVPVFDYFADATKNPFAQAVTPACYETPTAAGCDAEGVIALPSAGAPTAKAPLAGTQAIVVVNKDNSKFKQATYGVANHSTFADAGASMPTGNAQAAQANFVDMVQKSINLINGGGATADAK